MKLNLSTMFTKISTPLSGGGNAGWNLEIGQSEINNYVFTYDGVSDIFNGMLYNEVKDENLFDYGSDSGEKKFKLISVFNNVKLNIFNVEDSSFKTHLMSNPFIFLLMEDDSESHTKKNFRRHILKFKKAFKYGDISNDKFYDEIDNLIGENTPWFGIKMNYFPTLNKETNLLTFDIIKCKIAERENYINASSRSKIWNDYIKLYQYALNKGMKNNKDYNFNQNKISFNKIYFGPPGTGKSHAIKEYLKKYNVSNENYSRVTFHPDYDYHSFVGGYKPYTDNNDNDKIKYKFVPQIFTELYVKAWSNQDEHYFLIIEEINRGNCSEIFGDIFQLLDRNPEYDIEPSSELRDYLSEEEEKINVERIENGEEAISLLINGKLQMPDNLSILASMNTSDQSLYPMDSAFKRRWEWKYVPIDTECKDSNFVIKIKEDKTYSWLGFIDKVNRKIYSVTKSEDKQIGNWFIDASKSDGIISKEIFINKVLFYLWNDVFKDETYHQDNIFVQKNDDGTKIKDLSFNDFHKKDNQDKLLIHLFEKVLEVTKAEDKTIEPKTYPEQENTMSIAAEPSVDENDSE